MSATSELVRQEQALAQLLPSAGMSGDRTRLLAELSAYAAACVQEAQRRGPLIPAAEDLARARVWLWSPIFICGHHRSGTTLLQGLLDGHPELLVLPNQGTYFTSFRYVASAMPQVGDLERFIAEWIARCIDPDFEPHFRLGRSDPATQPYVDLVRHFFGWHGALHAEAPKPFAPLLALVAAFKNTLRAPEPRCWVEKTPLNEQHVGSLEGFGAARYIQVVRHPAATLASLRELHRGMEPQSFDADQHARGIAESLRLARMHRERLNGRYLVVRYEDLANETAREMARVRAFLSVGPHELLHVPTAGGSALRTNSSFHRGEAGVVNRARDPEQAPVPDAEAVSVFARRAARAFSYEISPPGLSTTLAVRLRSLPRVARERVRDIAR